MKITRINSEVKEYNFRHKGHTVHLYVKFKGLKGKYHKYYEAFFSIDNIGVYEYIYGCENGQLDAWYIDDIIVDDFVNYYKAYDFTTYYLEQYGY